eukprot:7313417-Prymnesium_polylepis.1
MSEYVDKSWFTQWNATDGSRIIEERALTSADMNALTGSNVAVTFEWSGGVVTVTVGGITLHQQATPEAIDPLIAASWRVFVGARTGGVVNEHRIDDVRVTYSGIRDWPPSPPAAPPPP